MTITGLCQSQLGHAYFLEQEVFVKVGEQFDQSLANASKLIVSNQRRNLELFCSRIQTYRHSIWQVFSPRKYNLKTQSYESRPKVKVNQK